MQRLGFNFHAQGANLRDRSAALSWVEENKPETILVLNDRKFASDCADRGVKNVILRLSANDDEIQLKLRSFQEWWDSVKAVYAEDKRLLVHFANEPHTDLEKLSKFSFGGMSLLRKEGYRGVFGNFSVGTPSPLEVKMFLTPMLEALRDIYHEHFLGVHEYMMGTPEWSTPDFITRYKQFDVPNIVITEFGFDFIKQIAASQTINIRGWKDHARYYQSKGNPNPEPFLFSMIKRVVQSYDFRVKGICFFCYGDSGGWSSYNAEDWDYLKDHAKDLIMTQTITNVTSTPLFIKGKTGNVNRRYEPNTTGKPSTVFLSTDPTSVNKIAITNDGWTQYIFTDGTFWLNDAVTEIVTDAKVTIELVNATPEDAVRFKDALKIIADLSAKYQIYATS